MILCSDVIILLQFWINNFEMSKYYSQINFCTNIYYTFISIYKRIRFNS